MSLLMLKTCICKLQFWWNWFMFFFLRREYGLEKFVPMSLLETMKRKELIKLLNQLIKQNQALGGPGQKQLSATQAKFHYLKIVSDLPSYGAKSFATCTKVRKTSLHFQPKFNLFFNCFILYSLISIIDVKG